MPKIKITKTQHTLIARIDLKVVKGVKNACASCAFVKHAFAYLTNAVVLGCPQSPKRTDQNI